jgi:hypothetical protein
VLLDRGESADRLHRRAKDLGLRSVDRRNSEANAQASARRPGGGC